MKILFLLPYSPVPPNSGNKNLTFNLLKYLTRHNSCDLVLLVEYDSDEEAIRKAIFAEFPETGVLWIFRKPKGAGLLLARIAALLRGYHPAFGRYRNRGLATWLTHHLKTNSYDIVHFDMFHMAQYWPFCKDNATVLVASDAYSLAARLARLATPNRVHRFSDRLQELVLRHYERNNYHKFDIVCMVSETDLGYLKSVCPQANLQVLGISIGEEFAIPKPRGFVVANGSTTKILCTGALSHYGAAEGILAFLENVYPEIMKIIPSAQLTLLGVNPVKNLLHSIKNIPSVTHVDYVPDYSLFLQRDWVYVYPQKNATGLQTKIQQAMALGLPVVGYPIAFGGLSIENGTHCFVCATEQEFGEAVTRLLSDSSLRQRIGLAAAEHTRTMFSIEKVGKDMMDIYRHVMVASK